MKEVYTTTSSSDGRSSRLTHLVNSYSERTRHFTTTQNFDKIILTSQSELNQFQWTDFSDLVILGHLGKYIKIDCTELHTVWILKTKLRNTALKGHLTAFKTNFLAVARTSLLTFVTSSGGAAISGTFSTPEALLGLYCSWSRLKFVQCCHDN